MSFRSNIFAQKLVNPFSINDLHIGIINGTAFQLLFTEPTGATVYEVYVDGVLKNTITGSGDYVVLLQQQTQYSIYVKAIKSVGGEFGISNTVIANTGISVVSQNGLLRYYKLDDSTTVALDSFANGNGTHSSGVVYGEAGKQGNSTKYTKADYTDLINNTSITPTATSPFSVCCWAKTPLIESATYEHRAFTFKRNNESSAVILGFDQANRAFFFVNGTAFRTPINSIAVNTLYHLGITYNGEKFTGYFNGRRLFEHTGTMPALTTYPVQISYHNPLLANSASADIGIIGNVDELPIYQRALTAGEMSDHFNNNVGITLIPAA